MNISNIHVNKYPVSQIFDSESKIVYEIPKYQREYSWGVHEWETLFDDIVENDEGYFLGSIICINTSTDQINEPKFEVVDGQQRLTTLSLFFSALYTILTEKKEDLDEEELSALIQLKRKIALKKSRTQDAIRLIPQVQAHNRDDYFGLLSKAGIIVSAYHMPNYAGLRRIVRGYDYFLKRIKNAAENGDDYLEFLFDLLNKLNSSIMVKIDVSNHADAHTLFESLNNRGMPLTAVDLIKNSLLARLENSGEEDIDYYFNRWTEIIGNLGGEYSEQERFFRQNYNAFRKSLNASFVKNDRAYPLGSMATRSTMLGIYEKLIQRDPICMLDTLSENSLLYSGIILNKTDEVSEVLKARYLDLQRVQGAPAYLLLMYLLKNKDVLNIDETHIEKVCILLVNFFVRRNITDTPPTRDLARMFMAYIEEIELNQYSGDAVYSHLRRLLISKSATDEQFREKLKGPVYDDNSGATRFILCMLAKNSMTLENEKDLWRKYGSGQYVWSIEHIFPQGSNIPTEWVNMIAAGDRKKAEEYQAEYVHTFGNLTITGYNSALGNKSFTEKKERKDVNGRYIGYRNGLNINDDVCDKDEWTVDVIKSRTERMVDLIMEKFCL